MEVKHRSEMLGHLLKVPRVLLHYLQQEYSDPQDHLLHVVDEFLKGVDPRPTWRAIIDALRHPLLRFHKLAQEIEKKYSGNYISDGFGLVLLQLFQLHPGNTF